jgi:succinate dehydrogenase / fumarate reductase cytochrome b subunit
VRASEGFGLYQLKEGQIAYILHRVSGVAVILFLFVHLVENFFLLLGEEAYNRAIGIYDTWYFRLGEFALIAAVVYHALNGTRIVVIDFWQASTRYQKPMWYAVMALSALILLPVAKIMLLDYPHWPWSGSGAAAHLAAAAPVLGVALVSTAYVSGRARPTGGERGELRLWYFMRLSGLLLVFLALFHLWLNHIQTEVGELSYDLVVGRLTEFPLLRVVDFLLLFLGLGHGVNGLKNVIDDHVHAPAQRWFWLSLLLVTFSVFLVAGTAVLFTLPLEAA